RRLEVLDLPRDLGRAEKAAWARKLSMTQAITLTGRVVVDPYDIIRRDPWVKLKRYDLRTVAKSLLGEEKLEMSGSSEITTLWKGGLEDLKRLVNYNRRDSELAMRLLLEKGLLDKFFEIAKISGLLLQDALGGQSMRHECKLLHEFRKRNFVMPCKPDGAELTKRKAEREEAGLKGALVLEPETGLHASGCTIVLDFTSLYPSLIKAFNICPTTWLKNVGPDSPPHFTSPFNTCFVKPEVREGVLPAIVRELINTRAAVRAQARTEVDNEKKRILNAKQLALKDMANSLYGYTGFVHGRIYVMDIANTITAYGRDTITNAKKIIEDNFPYKVIYADTDSTFIKTDIVDLDAAQEMGIKISRFVTERLPGLELKYEKLFRTFLIETKKRYAGWCFEKEKDGWKDKIEMKGIETVRRDWCALTSETMNKVLDIVLREGDVKKAAKFVRDVIADLIAGKVPLEKLTIVKGITKDLEEYDGVQPHVELAKKIVSRDPTKQRMVGERLEYVIVKGNALLSKRAEDPEFVKAKGMEIDSTYYIENQLLPPLERIFESVGVSRTELIHGTKQMSLLSALNGQKPTPSPEKTVLKSYEAIVCRKCYWSFRRPTLTGVCPTCGGQLFFSSGTSLGKFLEPTKS
ncbi:MAG: DNA polymerase domain-containing protein, partial [Candidatus Aenigmatarchaeota archaeon]